MGVTQTIDEEVALLTAAIGWYQFKVAIMADVDHYRKFYQ